jgi:hypothetical protein
MLIEDRDQEEEIEFGFLQAFCLLKKCVVGKVYCHYLSVALHTARVVSFIPCMNAVGM